MPATITRSGASRFAMRISRTPRGSARGELVLGGAFANPIDGAVLLSRRLATAEEFAKAILTWSTASSNAGTSGSGRLWSGRMPKFN